MLFCCPPAHSLSVWCLRYAIVLRLNLEIAYNVLIACRFCLSGTRKFRARKAPNVVSTKTSIKSLATVALFSITAFIAGCGGGGATDPYAVPPVVVIPALVVSPSTLTVVQGAAAALTISSGVGPFQAFSSNSFVLPVAQAVPDKTISLNPVNVTADTVVTITIRDAASQSTTVAVTVKPPVIPALVINPTTLIVYSGIPSVLTVERGVGPFQVFTSDSLVLPVLQAVTGTSVFLVASTVSADRTVTITLRDAAGQTVTVPVTVKPAPIASALVVTPTSLNIYSGASSRIVINSGVGPFQVFSTDAAVLPVTQAVSGNAITLNAATVSVDTIVTLTVRDAAAQTATIAVTVKPSPVLGVISITPSSNTTCGGAAANTLDRAAICSGESGIASITVRSALSVLPSRQVRFEVVQGAFNFVVDQSGAVLAKTITIVTDQNGKADVVIRTDAGVPSQAALIRATDITSGNRVDGAFTIVQATSGSAILSVLPPTHSARGGFVEECLALSGDYIIFGGTAPYAVTSGLPSLGVLSTATTSGQVVNVAAQGGVFRFTSNYVASGCTGFTVPITIADAAGRITSVTFVVAAGVTARVSAVLSPASVTFSANLGGSPLRKGSAAVDPTCTKGGTLNSGGTGCIQPTFAPAACSNGGAPNLTSASCSSVFTPSACTNASVNPSGGCLVPVFSAGPPATCSNGGAPNSAGTACLAVIVTPASCSNNGTLNSTNTGCVPSNYSAPVCSNGGSVNAAQNGCEASVFVPGSALVVDIPAVPNTQCSSSSVVYTINGGFVPYVLSSSNAAVTPATAVIATSPSNITITFPILNVGAVVTLTAVDAKGALFTSLASCIAGS